MDRFPRHLLVCLGVRRKGCSRISTGVHRSASAPGKQFLVHSSWTRQALPVWCTPNIVPVGNCFSTDASIRSECGILGGRLWSATKGPVPAQGHRVGVEPILSPFRNKTEATPTGLCSYIRGLINVCWAKPGSLSKPVIRLCHIH